MHSESLSQLSDEVLTTRIGQLVSRERGALVDFLFHLGEFERRRTYLELGFDSLWTYCTQHLRMAGGWTFRRTTAAHLLARFPAIGGYLESGRLCLTTLCLLKNVLDGDDALAILEQAAGMTEEEVKVLVA